MHLFRASIILILTVLGACTGETPSPEITAITPTLSYTDRDVQLTLVGKAFIPSQSLDPRLGYRQIASHGFQGRIGQNGLWVNLGDCSWHSTTEISAKLSKSAIQDLPAGVYDVEITDPRGATSLLPQALTLLGHDDSIPEISLLEPEKTAILGAGMEIHTRVVATDFSPGSIHQIQWRYSIAGIPQQENECTAVAPKTELFCPIDFVLDAGLIPGTKVSLEVWAFDTAFPPNLGTLLKNIEIAPPPAILSITPSYGASMGGTEIIIKGNNFLRGSRAYLGGNQLIPDGGIWVDSQTLTGHAPPHTEGMVDLLVIGQIGQSLYLNAFAYYGAPRIIRLVPEQGPPGTAVMVMGENFTNTTQISFGSVLQTSLALEHPSFQNSTAILGNVPFHIGKAIVWAFDPELGFSKLPNGYTFVSQ